MHIRFFKAPDLKSEKTLEDAYKKMSKQLHPDKNGGKDEDFKELGREYDILMKHIKRINTRQIYVRQPMMWGWGWGSGNTTGTTSFSNNINCEVRFYESFWLLWKNILRFNKNLTNLKNIWKK